MEIYKEFSVEVIKQRFYTQLLHIIEKQENFSAGSYKQSPHTIGSADRLNVLYSCFDNIDYSEEHNTLPARTWKYNKK